MSSRFVKSLHPMDENVYVTGELHQAYHHHLRVIAAEFGEGTMFQWTREKARVVYRILQNSQLSTYRRHIVPGENMQDMPMSTYSFCSAFVDFTHMSSHLIFLQRLSGHTKSHPLRCHTSRNLVPGMII